METYQDHPQSDSKYLFLGGGPPPAELSPINAAVMEVLGTSETVYMGHTSSRLCRDAASLNPQLRQR